MQIKVNCCSYKNLEGVVRLCEIDIEENELYNDEDIEKKIWNELSEKQYITDNKDWRKEVTDDILGCVNYFSENIEIIVV